jgi:hypothetical protein
MAINRITRAGLAGVTAALVAMAAPTAPVHAGGFSKSSGGAAYGKAVSKAGTRLKSGYIDYKSDTYAKAATRSLFGGKVLEATGQAGNDTSFYVKGDVKYHQQKKSRAKVYAKGGNVAAKARSVNKTTIHVGGKAYVVAKEVARAMARHTPLGTTAAADSQATLSAQGNGYIAGSTSTHNKAHVRVQR